MDYPPRNNGYHIISWVLSKRINAIGRYALDDTYNFKLKINKSTASKIQADTIRKK